jgi:tetratricopeptide (TPR) repeat protein
MDKSKKIYIKALDKYNNGYMDKAMELCEESISLDIKNSAAINLKGLLYYFKGELGNSQKLWKMNYQINKDNVAEKYLSNSKEDEERQKLYNLALDLINELKINEALNVLEKCAESDYNYINVNNYISLCHLNKGDNDKALEYVDKVLKLDRNNTAAKENIKTLKKYRVVDFKIGKKKIIILFAVIFMVILALSIKYIKNNNSFMINKLTKNNYISFFTKKVPINVKNQKNMSNKVQDNKVNNTNVNKSKVETEVFPEDKIKSDINNKDFEVLYEEYMKWKDKPISDDDKIIILQAGELLKRDSVTYFYNKGCVYMNNKDYTDAKAYLLKSYSLDVHSDLYPHIVYMLGTSCELSGDVENALRYYVQYDNSFNGGDYEDTVLYKLAILNKDGNKAIAKKYAQKLINKYPGSIYNNSVINDLANS